MLIIFFTTVVLLPVLAGFGGISKWIWGKSISGLSGKLISGVVFISLISTIVAFIFPLNIYYEIMLLSIGLSSFFYFKIYSDFRSFFSKGYKIFLPLTVVILFAGSFYPFILDYFGYYVPSVNWLSQFGLVRGISNLDLLLGQMSIWHIFQASFSGFTDPFLRINVVLLIIYSIYIIEKKSWLHLFFLAPLLFFLQSPSPDLPIIVFSLILLDEILSENQNINALFIFSTVIFAIKPTAVWLPLFVLLYGVFKEKIPLYSFIGGGIVLLLFLFKNIWTFGYPVFPMSFPKLGFSWQPNDALMKISSEVAVEKTFDMQYKFQNIRHFSKLEFASKWLFIPGIKSIIHLLFIASLLLFTIYTVLKNKIVLWILWIAILCKSAVVLLFSAQYRFFIEVFFIIFFVVFYGKTNLKKSLVFFSFSGILVLAVLAFPALIRSAIPSFRLGSFMMGFQKGQFYEPSVFAWKKYRTHTIGNLTFNVVEHYPFSFDVPLPAISPEFLKEDLDAGIFPQKNSEHLKDGFHWRKLSEEEHLKLEKIVDDLYESRKSAP